MNAQAFTDTARALVAGGRKRRRLVPSEKNESIQGSCTWSTMNRFFAATGRTASYAH
jgi:hypothetical protein